LSTYCSGGAGGGGWYGGGGGYVSAGGGGSSYVSYPGSTGASTTAGVNPGHGYIIITEICDALISSVSDDEVCEGETVTLSASSPGTGTISWDGGVTDGAAFEPPVGTTTYTATSTDPDDCPFSVDILVNPAPTVDAGLDTNLCEGEMLTLSGSGTADAYAWDGGVVDGVPFLPPGGTTMYHVTGDIVLTGCTAMDSVEVTMNNIDETVTVAGIDLTSNQSGASYQWVECPAYTDVAGATSQSFTPTQDGDYAVIITLNGCEDTSACETISGVGLTDIGLRDIVYPNPTSGEITIQFHGYFTYNIVNALGEKVISDAGKDVENLDISHLENGIYFIEIFAGENKSSFKVVKK
jgi:hypothetical protein